RFFPVNFKVFHKPGTLAQRRRTKCFCASVKSFPRSCVSASWMSRARRAIGERPSTPGSHNLRPFVILDRVVFAFIPVIARNFVLSIDHALSFSRTKHVKQTSTTCDDVSLRRPNRSPVSMHCPLVQ